MNERAAVPRAVRDLDPLPRARRLEPKRSGSVQAVSEGARSIWDEYRLLGEVFRGPATVAWSAEHVISGRRARLTTVHAPPMASLVTAEAVSHAFRRAAERAPEFTHPDPLPIIGTAQH